MLKRFLILLLLPLLLCACTKSTKEEITFSSWGSVTEVGILDKIIKNYENENPDVKINFMHVPQNYFQKIHLLFASNQAPDVLFINNLYLPIYSNKLEPLDDLSTLAFLGALLTGAITLDLSKSMKPTEKLSAGLMVAAGVLLGAKWIKGHQLSKQYDAEHNNDN